MALWSAHLFSEGTTLHLWQIRQFPNYRQTSLRLTFAAAAFAAVVVMSFGTMGFVAGQTAETAKEQPEGSEKLSAAEEFLQRVRQELPKHQSIKADVNQTVMVGNQQFKVTGEYLSAGQKLKLNYTVSPDQGAKGQMMEVCDGKDLWTMQVLPESFRVTHRNVQQIMAAAMTAQQNNIPESTVRVELGLGGIAALLASLERTMNFDGMKSDDSGDHPRTIVQGHWKPKFQQQFTKEKKDGEDVLQPFIPDRVRIYVNSTTLFPEQILYLKKVPRKRSFKPLVSLEFTNVQFDGPVNDDTFVFVPPDGINVEEVTQQYIDRMTGPATPPPAAN